MFEKDCDYEGLYYEARVLWNRGFKSLEILYRGSICAHVDKRFDSAIAKLKAAKTAKEIDDILEYFAGHLAS